MNDILEGALKKADNIKAKGLGIYSEIEVGDKKYWFTSDELEAILNNRLTGLNLVGLPLRTRSKVIKSEVCKALGYSVPSSFKKAQPRFSGQNFDTYSQKSNNLQVWNEDLDPLRRYVLIRINENDIVSQVKVISGSTLAPLDTTGKLTQKYQARLLNVISEFELISPNDTDNILPMCTKDFGVLFPGENPSSVPVGGRLLPIDVILERLKSIVGKSYNDPGSDQERNRGAELHKLVCEALGYDNYNDNGQFPDVRNQLLEVKLQTSPTVDLGLVSPSDDLPLDMEKIDNITVKHKDVRYAVFYAEIIDKKVNITNLILTTGNDFFGRMPRFEGKGLNKKLQIPLPKDFFKTDDSIQPKNKPGQLQMF